MGSKKDSFVFGKKNFLAIAIGFGIVIIGFMLMAGGKSDDPNTFNGEEIFSARRITVAPFTVLIGFITVGYGIMIKPKDDEVETSVNANDPKKTIQ